MFAANSKGWVEAVKLYTGMLLDARLSWKWLLANNEHYSKPYFCYYTVPDTSGDGPDGVLFSIDFFLSLLTPRLLGVYYFFVVDSVCMYVDLAVDLKSRLRLKSTWGIGVGSGRFDLGSESNFGGVVWLFSSRFISCEYYFCPFYTSVLVHIFSLFRILHHIYYFVTLN